MKLFFCVFLLVSLLHSGFATPNVQAIIDTTPAGGTAAIPSGTYTLTQELTVTNSSIVISGAGTNLTVIVGPGTSRCFNLGNTTNVVIENMTITGGGRKDGSGIYCANDAYIVRNCTLSNNVNSYLSGGYYWAGPGGGMYNGTAIDCLFVDNFARYGGGVYSGIAIGCTFKNNGAFSSGAGADESVAIDCLFTHNEVWPDMFAENDTVGGGGISGLATNCIFTLNSAFEGTACYGSAVNCTFYSNAPSVACTINHYGSVNNSILAGGDHIDSPTEFVACFFGDPIFVDALQQDFHIQTNSPCIDAGDNSLITASTDYAGNPRMSNRRVDIGAYESNALDEDSDGIPNSWEILYFGSITNCNPTVDSDGDHQINFDEFISGTVPTNAASYFHITNFTITSGTSVCSWNATSNRVYKILHSSDLTTGFEEVTTDINYPQNSFTDVTYTAESDGFYTVTVDLAE